MVPLTRHGFREMLIGTLVLAVAIAVTLPFGGALHGQSPSALPARGVEEGNGRTFIGEPVIVFPGHMASLFVTGKNPLAGKGTLQDLVNWTNDPLHSYIADGTGGLAVWAHPDPSWGSRILALDEGLVGMELYHGFDPLYYRDQLWIRCFRGASMPDAVSCGRLPRTTRTTRVEPATTA